MPRVIRCSIGNFSFVCLFAHFFSTLLKLIDSKVTSNGVHSTDQENVAYVFKKKTIYCSRKGNHSILVGKEPQLYTYIVVKAISLSERLSLEDFGAVGNSISNFDSFDIAPPYVKSTAFNSM